MRESGPISLGALRERIAGMRQMPSIPAILLPLIKTLESPPESIEVKRVVDLISHDKAVAAQTLHMANSPLFGRTQEVSTLRGAVVALGISRVRDIATSCCVMKLAPRQENGFDVRALWEHALGVALVSRQIARRIGLPAPEQAYLAGLLHDIGLVVNVLLFPEEFPEAAKSAAGRGVPIDVAEQERFGFGHAISGSFLAEEWGLADELKEVVRRHHQWERAQGHLDLVALVNLADLFCRWRGLGYGYSESMLHGRFSEEPSWQHLSANCNGLHCNDFKKLTVDLDTYLKEVRNLVSVVFRMQ
jgi:putative nucleotidyltransferase with HDIG domain